MFSNFCQKMKSCSIIRRKKKSNMKKEEQVGKFKIIDFDLAYLVTGKVLQFRNLSRRPMHQFIHQTAFRLDYVEL